MKTVAFVVISLVFLALGYILGSSQSVPGRPALELRNRTVLPSSNTEPESRHSPPKLGLRSPKKEGRLISEAELAISKISSFKALGLSDLRQLGFPEEERAGLVAVASLHLDKLKEIELRQARQITLSTGEQAIELAPFPEAYATWRSQLLADTKAIVDPVDSLIAVAAIENEFGHGVGFGLTTRRLWVNAHPESADCYILRTQFVDESDEQTSAWTQTFIGAKAPPRYDHLFSDAEAFKAEQE